MVKGIIVSGEYGNIIIREKHDNKLELGEILIAQTQRGKILLQVYDLFYASQFPPEYLELMSGLKLEENKNFVFEDPEIKNYVLARTNALIEISNNAPQACKLLPNFFSEAIDIQEQDVQFLSEKKNNNLFAGFLRSGSKTLNVPIYLDVEKIFSHHILISGTTGRGKSVLMTHLVWHILNNSACGILLIDPHDEYYGRTTFGLKDNPYASEYLDYYTVSRSIPGSKTLKINLESLHPKHFEGVMEWSDAQKQALNMFYKKFGNEWIASILSDKELDNVYVGEATVGVTKRKLMQLLDIEISNNEIVCKKVFDLNSGKTTVHDIISSLEKGKKVIIDTSEFMGETEILVGSIFAHELFANHKSYSFQELKSKPVVSIVLEEAPRVLGKEILERGPNIFSTLAREGRKFKIGITAITQLPSLIPREILANLNTKIILGVEMKLERQALIESASQDLSTYDRTIASLDKGEALISSQFTRFAIPIKIPNPEELVKHSSTTTQNISFTTQNTKPKTDFGGIT